MGNKTEKKKILYDTNSNITELTTMSTLNCFLIQLFHVVNHDKLYFKLKFSINFTSTHTYIIHYFSFKM